VQQAQKKFDAYIEQVHGRFINEEDFEGGIEEYKQFVEDYICFKYEPVIEEFDEARYFTRDFDANLVKKIRLTPWKRITSIELK